MEEAQAQSWQWPTGMSDATTPPATSDPDFLGSTVADEEEPKVETPRNAETRTAPNPEGPANSVPKPRRYGPRTCRICFDSVEPTFPDATTSTFGLGRSSKPTYVSPDPEDGRLISPCICKGSQKYVHEGCLQRWRAMSPANERNYMQCPTCKFRYRTDRLTWAAYLNHASLQLVLTALVMLLLVFVLGFVADPIINFWLDPLESVSDTLGTVMGYDDEADAYDAGSLAITGTWVDHFLKGFVAVGVAGFSKVLLAMSPWHWHSVRRYRGRRRAAGGTGRERLEDVGYGVAIIGVITSLGVVWKFIRSYVNRSLKEVSDRVLDVGNDDDDEEEDNSASKKNL